MGTVIGADGTQIAFEQTGAGPNRVLVHGTGTFLAPWGSISLCNRTAGPGTVSPASKGANGAAPAFPVREPHVIRYPLSLCENADR
jgi:hypothetical protein